MPDTTPPDVIDKNPDTDGTILASDSATFSISDDTAVDIASVIIMVDNEIAFAHGAWLSGWSGSSYVAAPAINGYSFEVVPEGGWRGIGSFTMRVRASDMAGNSCDESWSFSRERTLAFSTYPFIFDGIRKADEDGD